MIKKIFNEKEYHTLVEMVEIAHWILSMNEDRRIGNNTRNRFKKLEIKILSFAKEFGMDDHILYDKMANVFFTTSEFEEKYVTKEIEYYEEKSFLCELQDNLGERDFIRENGKKAIKKMPKGIRHQKLRSHINEYGDEFDKNGINRLEILTDEMLKKCSGA